MESSSLISSQLTTGEENFLTNSSNIIVPKEKKLIRCDLCGRTVNSASQAEAHFKGLYHLSQMQARGLPLPPDTDLEKLRLYNVKVMKAMKSPVRQLIAGPNFFNQRGPPAVFDVRMPGIGIPVTTIPPLSGMPPTTALPPPALVNSYPMNPAYNSTAHGKRVMCDICGVLTNSQTQAQSHLNGRKHLTRLAELGMPVPRDVAVDFLEASSQSLRRNNKINHEVPKLTVYERFTHRAPQQIPAPRFQYSPGPGPRMLNYRSIDPVASVPFRNGHGLGARGSKHPVRMRSLIPCETCQLLFNSHEQAQAHFNGNKHQKRLRMINYYQRNVEKTQVRSSSVKQMVCPVCSTSVNSDKQMDAHVQGKLHKSKLEQNTGMVREDDGGRVLGQDSEATEDLQPQQDKMASVTNSVAYDLANCVPGSSLNSNLYHQQHFAGSEREESTEVAAADSFPAANQTI